MSTQTCQSLLLSFLFFWQLISSLQNVNFVGGISVFLCKQLLLTFLTTAQLCLLWTNPKLFLFFFFALWKHINGEELNKLVPVAEFVPTNFCRITFRKLQQSRNGSLTFWGQIMSRPACTRTHNRQHTLVHENPHRCGQQARSCTLFGLDIGNRCSLIDAVGFSDFTHTRAAVKTMPLAQMEVFVHLESYQKAFGFDSKVLVSLYSSPTWALATVSC